MIYLFRVLQGLFGYLGRMKSFLPVGVAGIFLVIQFFIDASKVGFTFAFEDLSKSVLATELVINEKVHLAILDSTEYGLIDFFQILMSLYIIYKLMKFIAKLLIKIAGAQAEWGAYFISLLIVGIIEIATIKFIDGQFGFLPIYNGIIFLFMNIGPVISNIF